MNARATLLRHTEKYIAKHGITALTRATGVPSASLRRFVRGEGDLTLPSIAAMLDAFGLEIAAKKTTAKRRKG